MSSTTRAVATKDELKQALQDGVENIYIVDLKLANYVRTIKSAKKGVVIAAAVAAGVATVGRFGRRHPLGQAVDGIASAANLSSKSVLITAIAALAMMGTVFMIMVKDYELDLDLAGSAENDVKENGKQSPQSKQKAAGNLTLKLKKAQKA